MITEILSTIVTTFVKWVDSYKSRPSNTAKKMAYRRNWSRGARGGSWAAQAFANIVNAHSCCEEVVEEFEIDSEYWFEPDPELGMTPYDKAYEEAKEEAEALAAAAGSVDVEDFIDWDQLREDAFDYACDWVDRMLTGTEWIPEGNGSGSEYGELLSWAFYDVSSHN